MSYPRFPDFLVIGAMKAGTTTLYRDLLTNAHVFMPDTKETDELTHDDVLTDRGRVQFAKHFERAQADQICGEASTSSSKLPDFPGVPERALEIIGPDLKIIYLVREPVARAVSHHHHDYCFRLKPANFEQSLSSYRDLIQYSQYHMQIRAWLAHFDLNQIMVIPFEEYTKSRRDTISAVSQFLGIPAQPEAIEQERVFNDTTKDKRIAVGTWARLAKNPIYRNLIRPWLPLELKDKLRNAMLPNYPDKQLPTVESVERIIEAVAGDAEELRVLLGRDQPFWDFDSVLARYTDENAKARA